MRHLVIVLLLAGAVDAAAKPHTVEVRIFDGKNIYAKKLKVEAGKQVSFTGQVFALGAPGRWMIANVLLNEGVEPELQYQVELSGGQGSPDPFIQGQGELSIKPGKSVPVLDCGVWSVELGLDRAGKKKAEAWYKAGTGNIRLSAQVLKAGRAEKICRQVSRNNINSNAVDGFSSGERRLGFILNSIVTASAERAGELNLQYQVEHNPAVGAESFQLQGDVPLKPGVKTGFKSGSYLVEFLIEGGKTVAAAGAGAVKAKVPAAALQGAAATP